MKTLLTFSTAFVLSIVLCPLDANAQTPEGNSAKGKDLFLKYSCYSCHGFSGQNGPGARLVPMKIAQAGFVAYVRNPPQPNRMPSYSAKAVPDAEMADIYTYIKSMPDASVSPKSVAILNQLMEQVK
jgi:mono/diheme cytochrome c family protein